MNERLGRLKRQSLGWALLWMVIIGASLGWNIYNEKAQSLELAWHEARANFNKDQAFRQWATLHGGVYVPVGEYTQPHPYLSHIPERDIETPSGVKLTLMNPAYMLRQMMDYFSELYGVKGRIVSFKPLNSSNTPDQWESLALLAFENGLAEKAEISNIADEPHLRYMRPMIVKEGCLKCHSHQGYKLGDIRGGVGVSVPLKPYLENQEKNIQRLAFTHGGLWLVGFFGLGWFYQRSRLRIKEQLAQAQEIEHLNHLNQQILSSAGEGIYGVNRDGKTIFINPTAIKLTGWEEKDLLGKEQHRVLHHSHKDGKEYKAEDCPIVQTLKDGSPKHISGEVFWRQDGSCFPVEYSVTPIKEGKETTGAVVVFRDVSKKLKVLQELERSNKELESFAYAVSHDLREPLRTISNYMRLLEHRYGPELSVEAREFASFAVDGARRMDVMINGLLSYSRINTKGAPFSTVDCRDVLTQVLEALDFAISEAGAEIEIGFLPKVQGDNLQLISLFQNIISNALKYRDPGRRLLISINAELKQKEWYFQIKDNGIGIRAENLERIFNLFQRVDGNSQDGSGIGLAVCKRIVERHGGRIWAVSKFGEGSGFTFTLPYVDDLE